MGSDSKLFVAWYPTVQVSQAVSRYLKENLPFLQRNLKKKKLQCVYVHPPYGSSSCH
jgi:hypothetical protein